MLNTDGHRIDIETFIDEVMQAQQEEGTRGFAIELDNKYTIIADDMRVDDDLIFTINGDDVAFIPEHYCYDMTYAMVVNEDSGSLIIALAEI